FPTSLLGKRSAEPVSEKEINPGKISCTVELLSGSSLETETHSTELPVLSSEDIRLLLEDEMGEDNILLSDEDVLEFEELEKFLG
ncbi:hypothetical protein, partial [Candidatus Similichlamydia epinepheli]|uniref:hypothetical protein n=1 Tax=Candidatus Similichlamydia epinepheli TaxID=1903953 RepID=UPI0013002454